MRKCPSCGALIDSENTTSKTLKCGYCGCEIPNDNYDAKKTRADEIRNEIRHNINNTNTTQTKNEKSKLNGCLLITLLFVFWPAGLVYLIIHATKKD